MELCPAYKSNCSFLWAQLCGEGCPNVQPHNLHRASVRDQFLLVMLNLGESPRLQGWSSPRKNDRNKIWSKKVPSQPFGVPAIYTKKIGEKRELHQVESFVANITQLKLPTDFSAVFELTIDHTSQGGSLDSQPLKRSRFHHPKKVTLSFFSKNCFFPKIALIRKLGYNCITPISGVIVTFTYTFLQSPLGSAFGI